MSFDPEQLILKGKLISYFDEEKWKRSTISECKSLSKNSLKKRNTERRKRHRKLLPNANKKEEGKLKNVNVIV